MQLRILPLHPEMGKSLPLPQRMSEHASGFDVAAAIDAPLTLAPGARRLVPCGFAMAFPHGFEAQVRPRSGLAAKHGVTVLNAPGTIDADYRGQVQVILVNLGQEPFVIEPGMRIAQIVFAAVATPEIQLVQSLDGTSRGDGGFGSTGR